MDAAALADLVPYVLSLLISCAVGGYAWRRHADPGAAAYGFVALSQASWTFGTIFELISPKLEGKIFWDNFQFMSGGGWMLGFAAFTFCVTRQRLSRPWLLYGLLSLPALATVALAYTDSLHGLIRLQPTLVAEKPISPLVYGFTPVIMAWTVYGYAVF